MILETPALEPNYTKTPLELVTLNEVLGSRLLSEILALEHVQCYRSY